MNLYELTGEYKRLLDVEADVSEEAFADTLESIEGEIEEKVDGYGKVITSLLAEAGAIKEEEKRLADKRNVLENRASRLKENLEQAMISLDKDKIKTTLFTASFRKTPGSVNVLDETLVPKEYFVEQAPRLDKKTILGLLKEGQEVEGVELKTGRSFSIK